MIRKSAGIFLVFLMSAAANAATTSTTMTIDATGSVATLSVSGTATFTNGVGSGAFAATIPLSGISGGSANVAVPFAVTFSAANILKGTITVPLTLLLTGGQGSNIAVAITSDGTGTYSGASGSFTLAGSGTASATGAVQIHLSGPGSITTGGGGSTGPTPPVITALQNNYSYILPGLPNYGIAPGTLFIIKGTNLNNSPITSLQSSAAPGLQKTLNGTSVSVTVNGTTTNPVFYYSSPSQLGMVLPSSTPVGTGTITVTNSGTASAPFPIQVVQSAFGIDSLYGSGTGAGVATDASGNIFTATNSAAPGQTIVLWGSGVGADTSNDDATYPLKQNNLTSIPFTVYIGGMSANILYRGRSQYPGVDQVVVTIPAGVATGCSVSLVTVSGNVSSNFVTLPIAANNAACSDPNLGISGTTAINLSGKSSVNFGFVGITQSTSAGLTPGSASTTTNNAAAIFENVSGIQFASNAGANAASIGSCVVNAPTIGTGSIPNFTGLDAGTLTVNGPSGTVSLQGIPGFLGFYGAELSASAIPASGGAFTFNATGGKNVGAFNTTVNFPVPLVWTNMNSITSVNRAQGVTVNWTGGAAGTYVQINGSSTSTIGGSITSVSFTCNAPVSAGTFTVPPPVLLALPAGSGDLEVSNSTNPQTFTASGLDLGYQFASVSSSISPSYN